MLRYWQWMRTAGNAAMRGNAVRLTRAGVVFGTGTATGAGVATNTDWRAWHARARLMARSTFRTDANTATDPDLRIEDKQNSPPS